MKPLDPPLIGRYVLVGRLGEGGMGEVFLGRSPDGFEAAVKLIRAERVGDPQFRGRFKREVETAKKAGGFYTAPLLDADPEAERPWLATAYIAGPTLGEAVISHEHGRFTEQEVRALAAELVAGLADIHANKVVHRDLKPSNVIMALGGPRIIDFGIARHSEATTHTAHGALVGTYAYMSPEQIAPLEGQQVGAASDVFSLGCVLTFAATGRPPFAGDWPALGHKIVYENPDLSMVPASIRPLIADCLIKDPADRPTVAVLRDRLRKTGDVPQSAEWITQPSNDGSGSRTVPGAQARRRGLIISRRWLIFCGLAAAGLGAAGTAAALEIPRHFRGGGGGGGGDLPAQAGPVNPVLRGVLTGHTDDVVSLAFNRDGTILASGGADNQARLWNPNDRRGRAVLPTAADILSVAFSPDGTTLAGGAADGKILLWNVATGRSIATIAVGAKPVHSVAFSTNGTILAASDGTEITLWNVANHSSVGTLTGHRDEILATAVSPDGKTLASGGKDTEVRLWDLANHSDIAALVGPQRLITSMTFSPDGKILVAGGADGRVWSWDVTTGRSALPPIVAHIGAVTGVAVNSTGTIVASSGDARVRLWDRTTGRELATLSGHRGVVRSVAFGRDGKTLASGGDDATIRLWTIR